MQIDTSIKKPAKAQQKPLHITSAMALAFLDILPRAMIWFFNSWDYLFNLILFVYLYNTWTSETEDNILVYLRVLVIVGDALSNAGKTKNKAACENQGKQRELSDHWKSIKTLFLKK